MSTEGLVTQLVWDGAQLSIQLSLMLGLLVAVAGNLETR